MSKELTKFQARYKKLAPKVKVYTKKAGQGLGRKVSSAFQDATFHGEKIIAEAMANARDNGVTGNKYGDFIKDKGFQDAIKIFDKAVAEIDRPQKELKKFCAQAQQAADELAVLYKDIEKDLKKRKDKSESKAEIEKLKAQIEKDWGAVTTASKAHDDLPEAQQEYVGNFQKTVEKIMKQAPAAQAAQRDSVALPQMLVDRNRKRGRNKSITLAKEIQALCEEAMQKAETGGLKDAQPALKKAAGQLKDLKKVKDEFDKALAHTSKLNSFKKSKDKGKIEDDVATIGKAYQAAERQLRGVSTTLRKAGV